MDEGSLPVLEARGLTVRFGGVLALDDVSFSVAKGEIHAVIGPNGAGKSTCFNAMTALYPLASGSVHLRGEDLSGLHPRRIIGKGVARTFQNMVMPGHLTVAETMRVGRHHLTHTGLIGAGLGLPSARRERTHDLEAITAAAAIFGIESYLDQPVGRLPYGIRKKVEIARAICAEPSVLLLDEPVAGMNDAESRALGLQIRECRDEFGLTVLLVEHDMELVMSLSDHVTVLQTGRVIADGTPAHVQHDPAVIDAYLGTDAAAPESDSEIDERTNAHG